MLAVAVLASASLPAVGDWKDSYAKGVQAKELGDWKTAIPHFEQAIRERSRAGGQVRLSGMRFEEYTPYYHLGVAYDKVGNSAKAREMMERSIRQNVIKAKSRPGKDREKILARLKSLEPKTEQVSQAVVTAAGDKVKTAADLETALRKKTKDPGFAALAKRKPELTDGLDKLFADRAKIATRFAGAKTESDFKSVGKAADELGQRLKTAGVNLDKGLTTGKSNRFAAATEGTVRSISEAKKSGSRLTAQRKQALGKDSTLGDRWSSADRTLADAEQLYAKGSKSHNLQQIEQARELADRVTKERNNILAQVERNLQTQAQARDQLARTNQDIDQLEGESRGLLSDVDMVDSPSSKLSSRRASLETALGQRPANDAPLKDLKSYLVRLRSESTGLVSAMDSDRLSHAAQLESAKDDARGVLAQAANADSPSSDLPLAVAMVEKLLAEEATGDGYLTQLRQAVDDLEIAMVPDTIDQRLARAYQAYVKCDYDAVETALGDATFDRAWLNVQANLFRAAAFFARYVQGGEQDDSLRERARQAVQECLRLDPDYLPREAVFTPPFLAFYRES